MPANMQKKLLLSQLRFLCNFKCNHARLHFQNLKYAIPELSFHRTLPKKESSAATSSAVNKPGPSHRKEVVDEAPLAEEPAIGKHLWWSSFIVVNV
jgi:hypothetical protein